MPPPRQRDLFARRASGGPQRTRALAVAPGRRAARALRRHGLLALLALGGCLAAAWLGAGLVQPVYAASASLILVSPPAGTAIGATTASPTEDPGVALETLAQELGARALVADAARAVGPGLTIHWLRPRYRLSGTAAPERVETAALGQLRITPVTGSRIVELESTAPSPALAMAFLSALLDRHRAQVTAAARAQAQAELSSLRQQTGVAELHLQQAQAALTAQAAALGLADPAAQLAAAEQRWQQLAAAATTSDLAAWQQDSQLQAGLNPQPPAALEAQRATLMARIARLQAQYLPQAAPLLEARQELAGLDVELQSSRALDRQAAAAALAAVHRQQADLEGALARAAARQQNLHGAVADLDQAQRQLVARQTTYSALLQRLDDAVAQTDAFQLPWQLLSQPQVWPVPLRPRRAAMAGAALALGTVLAAVMVTMAEWTDDRLRYPEAAELGLPLVAALPAGPATEAGLERCAAALLRAQSDSGASVILVTSLEPGAGKTNVARALAALLQQAAPVLVLEGNSRRPAVHRAAHAHDDVSPEPGLIELLSGRARVEQVLRMGPPGAPNRICSGLASAASSLLPLAGSPATELLAAARQRHDWVLVDGAALEDGPETELWAGLCDCALVVARLGLTSRPRLRRACDLLEAAGAGAVALLLTEVPVRLAGRIHLDWLGSEPSPATTEIAAWRQRAG